MPPLACTVPGDACWLHVHVRSTPAGGCGSRVLTSTGSLLHAGYRVRAACAAFRMIPRCLARHIHASLRTACPSLQPSPPCPEHGLVSWHSQLHCHHPYTLTTLRGAFVIRLFYCCTARLRVARFPSCHHQVDVAFSVPVRVELAASPPNSRPSPASGPWLCAGCHVSGCTARESPSLLAGLQLRNHAVDDDRHSDRNGSLRAIQRQHG